MPTIQIKEREGNFPETVSQVRYEDDASIGEGIIGAVYKTDDAHYVVKVAHTPEGDIEIGKEYANINRLWQALHAEEHVALPPIALGTDVYGHKALVQPYYKQLLSDEVRRYLEDKRWLEAERLIVQAALDFQALMVALENEGLSCTDRKAKDFFYASAPNKPGQERLVVIDWNVLNELNDTNRAELNVFGHIWHQIALQRAGVVPFRPLEEAAWQPYDLDIQAPDLEAAGFPSVGLRYILAVAVVPEKYAWPEDNSNHALYDLVKAWNACVQTDTLPPSLLEDFFRKLSQHTGLELSAEERDFVTADLRWRLSPTDENWVARQKARSQIQEVQAWLPPFQPVPLNELTESLLRRRSRLEEVRQNLSEIHKPKTPLEQSHLGRWEHLLDVLAKIEDPLLPERAFRPYCELVAQIGLALSEPPNLDTESSLNQVKELLQTLSDRVKKKFEALSEEVSGMLQPIQGEVDMRQAALDARRTHSWTERLKAWREISNPKSYYWADPDELVEGDTLLGLAFNVPSVHLRKLESALADKNLAEARLVYQRLIQDQRWAHQLYDVLNESYPLQGFELLWKAQRFKRWYDDIRANIDPIQLNYALYRSLQLLWNAKTEDQGDTPLDVAEELLHPIAAEALKKALERLEQATTPGDENQPADKSSAAAFLDPEQTPTARDPREHSLRAIALAAIFWPAVAEWLDDVNKPLLDKLLNEADKLRDVSAEYEELYEVHEAWLEQVSHLAAETTRTDDEETKAWWRHAWKALVEQALTHDVEIFLGDEEMWREISENIKAAWSPEDVEARIEEALEPLDARITKNARDIDQNKNAITEVQTQLDQKIEGLQNWIGAGPNVSRAILDTQRGLEEEVARRKEKEQAFETELQQLRTQYGTVKKLVQRLIAAFQQLITVMVSPRQSTSQDKAQKSQLSSPSQTFRPGTFQPTAFDASSTILSNAQMDEELEKLLDQLAQQVRGFGQTHSQRTRWQERTQEEQAAILRDAIRAAQNARNNAEREWFLHSLLYMSLFSPPRVFNEVYGDWQEAIRDLGKQLKVRENVQEAWERLARRRMALGAVSSSTKSGQQGASRPGVASDGRTHGSTPGGRGEGYGKGGRTR